jgi:hypothetical protein
MFPIDNSSSDEDSDSESESNKKIPKEPNGRELTEKRARQKYCREAAQKMADEINARLRKSQ